MLGKQLCKYLFYRHKHAVEHELPTICREDNCFALLRRRPSILRSLLMRRFG
jgi:hypothetical protein